MNQAFQQLADECEMKRALTETNFDNLCKIAGVSWGLSTASLTAGLRSLRLHYGLVLPLSVGVSVLGTRVVYGSALERHYTKMTRYEMVARLATVAKQTNQGREEMTRLVVTKMDVDSY